MTSYLPLFGSPVDLIMAVLAPLRDKGVHVYPAFEENMLMPAVVPLFARRSGQTGWAGHDKLFTRVAILELNTITDGPDADETADKLHEACRRLIFDAWLNQAEIPGVGVINRVDNSTMASQVSDWQTSTGVVQYANLPNGAQRFEAIYRLLLRPPRRVVPVNQFI